MSNMRRGRFCVWMLAGVAALTLGGCAAAQKKACESGDWEGLGLRDGRDGRGYERVAELSERCSDYDISVDSAAWAAGHARGLAQYCEPAKGFDLGEAGNTYTGNCPPALEGRFLESYLRGLTLRRDERQLSFDRLRRDLDDARRSRDALAPDADAGDAEQRIAELEQALENNLAERGDINALIGRWGRQL